MQASLEKYDRFWAKLLFTKAVFIVLFSFLFSSKVFAQAILSKTDTITSYKGDSIHLSYFPVVPLSEKVFLNGKKLSQNAYFFDYENGKILLIQKVYIFQNLVVQYNYFPSFLKKKYVFREFNKYKNTQGKDSSVVKNYFSNSNNNTFLGGSKIKTSGSISRAITVGNNRDLAVNSGLRLQLEGKVTDDVSIIGALTDENIPIQPDGTTQQINDFDKVFIQLKKDKHTLSFGDYELNHQSTNFSNFYRDLQGVILNLNWKKHQFAASGAVSKGKFYSNSFFGKNGVQGPYVLTGKDNEQFIIILAGSEKVYVDGELMTRGEVNDYIMDYNTGQLTFTRNRVVNNQSRIVVDFEYIDNNYSRSMVFTSYTGKFFKEKLKLSISYVREADNQNASIVSLSDSDKVVLSNAGDDPNLAFNSGVDSLGFSSIEPRYERNDTILYGLNFERYVYSTNPDSAVYKLTFAYVGAGNGMYVRDPLQINQNIFKWSPPDSAGNLTGDYNAIKVLPLPKKNEVTDVILEYSLSKKVKIFSELALSNYDRNRFSSIDDHNNFGIASLLRLHGTKVKISPKFNLNFRLDNKYVEDKFQNIDRVTKKEYSREWNYNDLTTRLDEHVVESALELWLKDTVGLKANIGYRRFGLNTFNSKQVYQLESKDSSLFLGNYTLTYIQTENKEDSALVSTWLRHNADISKPFGKLLPGIVLQREIKKSFYSDTLGTNSFDFLDIKPYLKTILSKKLVLDFYWIYRHDRQFYSGKYREKAEAITHFYKINFTPNKRFFFQNTSSIRNFTLLDTAFYAAGLKSQNNFMTSFQTIYQHQKRLIFTNFFYEVSSEQTAQLKIAYIEVTPGQGQYEWIDYNEDDVQDLDEFQLSTNPLTANFIRVFVPTQDFRPSIVLKLSTNLRIEFKKVIKKSKKKLKQLLKNTILQTLFRVEQKKNAEEKLANYILDFNDLFGDTSVFSVQYNFRQDLFLFRNNIKGDLSFSFLDSRNKLYLVTGNENRTARAYIAKQRWNLDKKKSFVNEFQIGDKKSVVENLPSRNYNISYLQVSPTFNWQKSNKSRFSIGFEYKYKVNNAEDSTNANLDMMKLIFDAKIQFKNRNSIQSTLELFQMNLSGTPNVNTQFELLESFQPGRNAHLTLFLTQFLSKNLELNIIYDGRASENFPMIHTGRMQVRLIF